MIDLVNGCSTIFLIYSFVLSNNIYYKIFSILIFLYLVFISNY